MRSRPELSPSGACESLHTSAVSAAAPAARTEDRGSRRPGRRPWLCPAPTRALAPRALSPGLSPWSHPGPGLVGRPTQRAPGWWPFPAAPPRAARTSAQPAVRPRTQKSGSRGSNVKAKDATPRTIFQGVSSGQCPGPGRDILAQVACRPGCAFPRAQPHQPSGPGSIHGR